MDASSALLKNFLSRPLPARSVTLPASSRISIKNAAASSPLAMKRLLSRSRPARSMTLRASSLISSTNAAAAVYKSDDGDLDSDDVDVRFFCPFYGGFVKPEAPLDFENLPAVTGILQDWEPKQTDEGLHLLMDMPGLSKEDVKLTVEENKLVVEGNGKNEFGDKVGMGRSYSGKIDLPSQKLYEIKAIKAEMKNGVLKAFVPMIKDEEKTADVFEVSIE
ncbi:hypothetical protein CASFOL_008441 [Castilleja foliolosa]|uniref:SHSP domain-containing protein n=1 Tax=Castilleja foliolosa TaxID=1961234 RepID=A0ABD3DYY3_9LAMI